ncbi:MAG TPA: hypothetical protein DER39_10970, partial [Porphyromonadaceae bacterium]|nr:hypothetical protein [Porphyromonadaceae bacterium]
MKFIYITCNVSMLETVTSLLDEEEITDYQVMEQVTAKSNYSLPRLNTAVWPGYNSSVFIQESDKNKVSSLIETINRMNRSAFNNGERISQENKAIRSPLLNADRFILFIVSI